MRCARSVPPGAPARRRRLQRSSASSPPMQRPTSRASSSPSMEEPVDRPGRDRARGPPRANAMYWSSAADPAGRRRRPFLRGGGWTPCWSNATRTPASTSGNRCCRAACPSSTSSACWAACRRSASTNPAPSSSARTARPKRSSSFAARCSAVRRMPIRSCAPNSTKSSSATPRLRERGRSSGRRPPFSRCRTRGRSCARRAQTAIMIDWRTRFLVDASGRSTVTSRVLAQKRPDPRNTSAAIFGHFHGIAQQQGARAGNIRIYLTRPGWMWQIPLRGGLTSIGLVAPGDYLRAREGGIEGFFGAHVKRHPHLVALLSKGRPANRLQSDRQFLVPFQRGRGTEPRQGRRRLWLPRSDLLDRRASGADQRGRSRERHRRLPGATRPGVRHGSPTTTGRSDGGSPSFRGSST